MLILLATIYILILVIYLINPIKYSSNNIYYIPLHKLYYYITIILIILHLLFTFYINNKYQITNKYFIFIPLIIGIMIINNIYSKPIVNDDSYNVPPSFTKKIQKYLS